MNNSMGQSGIAKSLIAAAAAGVFSATAFAAGPGEAIGPPVRVTDAAYSPPGAVASALDGRSVAVWADFDSSRVLAQRYAANGSAVGTPITVADASNLGQFRSAHVAMNAAGDFVVSREQLGVSGLGPNRSPARVVARSFRADGTPLGNEIVVASANIDSLLTSSVAIDDDGDYVVTWARSLLTQGIDIAPLPGVYFHCCQVESDSLRVRRFSADGTPLTRAIQVDASTTFGQFGTSITPLSVASDGAGNFTLAWTATPAFGPSSVYTRGYSAAGIALGPQRAVNGTATVSGNAAIAMTRGGAYTVAWGCSRTGNGLQACLRNFLAGGTDASNVVVAFSQPLLSFALAVDASGRPVIAATVRRAPESPLEGPGMVQVFGTDGSALGAAQPINPTGPVVGVAVSSDGNGGARVLYSAINGTGPVDLQRYAGY